MRNRTHLFAAILLVVVSTALSAQHANDAAATRVSEAMRSFALFADTYTVQADTLQVINMELVADGETFSQKTRQDTNLQAVLDALDEDAPAASGRVGVRMNQNATEEGRSSSNRAQVSGSVRLVEDTLYVDLESTGTMRSAVPGGWAILVDSFVSRGEPDVRFEFDFPGRDDLLFDELLPADPTSTGFNDDLAFLYDVIAIAESTSTSTLQLADGTVAEELRATLVGPQILQIDGIADDLLASTADVPRLFVDALLESMELRTSIVVDEQEFFRGYTMDARLGVQSDNLRSLLGDMVPEGTEGSVQIDMTIREQVTFLDINAPAPPISRP